MLSLGGFSGGLDTQSIITAPSGFRAVGFHGGHWQDYTSAGTSLAEIVVWIGLVMLPL
jgi:hypothetical protein